MESGMMEYLEQLGEKAVAAKYALQRLTTEDKNRGLEAAAAALVRQTERILAANGQDYQRQAACRRRCWTA